MQFLNFKFIHINVINVPINGIIGNHEFSMYFNVFRTFFINYYVTKDITYVLNISRKSTEMIRILNTFYKLCCSQLKNKNSTVPIKNTRINYFPTLN